MKRACFPARVRELPPSSSHAQNPDPFRIQNTMTQTNRATQTGMKKREIGRVLSSLPPLVETWAKNTDNHRWTAPSQHLLFRIFTARGTSAAFA